MSRCGYFHLGMNVALALKEGYSWLDILRAVEPPMPISAQDGLDYLRSMEWRQSNYNRANEDVCGNRLL